MTSVLNCSSASRGELECISRGTASFSFSESRAFLCKHREDLIQPRGECMRPIKFLFRSETTFLSGLAGVIDCFSSSSWFFFYRAKEARASCTSFSQEKRISRNSRQLIIRSFASKKTISRRRFFFWLLRARIGAAYTQMKRYTSSEIIPNAPTL